MTKSANVLSWLQQSCRQECMNATLNCAVMGIGENVRPLIGRRSDWITSLFAMQRERERLRGMSQWFSINTILSHVQEMHRYNIPSAGSAHAQCDLMSFFNCLYYYISI